MQDNEGTVCTHVYLHLKCKRVATYVCMYVCTVPGVLLLKCMTVAVMRSYVIV